LLGTRVLFADLPRVFYAVAAWLLAPLSLGAREPLRWAFRYRA
jgi:hypothetical protein